MMMPKKTLIVFVLTIAAAGSVSAVTSAILRQKTSDDLLKGKSDGVIVDSQGVIRLAQKTEKLDCGKLLDDAWTINSILSDQNGTIYAGTSPQGKIIRLRDGNTELLYPQQTETKTEPKAEDPNDPNAIQSAPQPNEHIFAMAFDVAGRVLAGVSGEQGKLIRISTGSEVVFENEKVQYIFAIVLDSQNNIYLATGPNGQLWKLDAFAQNSKLLCTLQDKNILSLAMGKDGFLYAGTDTRGLVYRIHTDSGTVEALYDSEQDEITALLIDEGGSIFAAATSGSVANQTLQAGMSLKKAPGKPSASGDKTPNMPTNSLNLKPANSDEQKSAPAPQPTQTPKIPAPKSAGHIYKISPEGFVTDVFMEPAVFYSLLSKNGKLLLGVGPKAKLFSIDPMTEERAVAFEDMTSSQITAMACDGKEIYLALANPAGIVRLSDSFSRQGVYTSDLLDAGQPARWGKVQLDAQIPAPCEVWLATRSGNVKDPNDPTLSPWSPDVKFTEPTDAVCPVGRFCQYRLTLKSSDDKATPTIHEIAVAHVVPNLPPQVMSAAAQKTDKLKPYMMTIQVKAEDENKDQLEFSVEMRKQGRESWILLKDKLEQPKYDWDTRTAEDGRYEIRITASDRLSNNQETALTGSRISDPIVVDNTAPAIAKAEMTIEGTTVKLSLNIQDELSVVARVQYTIDSDTTMQSCLPTDGIYDTTQEEVVIVAPDLKPGQHVIGVSVADDMGNTAYKTWMAEIK
jgi:outer membrane protein assembly factor BamB